MRADARPTLLAIKTIKIYERTENAFEKFGANNCLILPKASEEQGEENEEK